MTNWDFLSLLTSNIQSFIYSFVFSTTLQYSSLSFHFVYIIFVSGM